MRARYNGEKSGPWSVAREVTVSATPPPPKKGDEQGEGDSNEGRSTNPPAKPTGLLTGRSHDTVILFWTNPDDDTITGYQVLRGDTAANLPVLTADTGDASTSYTDDTVSAGATYAYAIRARNAHGLSPQSDPVSVTTLAPPPGEELTTELATTNVSACNTSVPQVSSKYQKPGAPYLERLRAWTAGGRRYISVGFDARVEKSCPLPADTRAGTSTDTLYEDATFGDKDTRGVFPPTTLYSGTRNTRINVESYDIQWTTTSGSWPSSSSPHDDLNGTTTAAKRNTNKGWVKEDFGTSTPLGATKLIWGTTGTISSTVNSNAKITQSLTSGATYYVRVRINIRGYSGGLDLGTSADYTDNGMGTWSRVLSIRCC